MLLPLFSTSLLLLLLFTFLNQILIAHSKNSPQHSSSLPINQPTNKCGNILIPYPFQLTTTHDSVLTHFHLSCLNSSTLYLKIDQNSYKIIQFFNDGLLVDFTGFTSSCREYTDLNSFRFVGNQYFGFSPETILGLYNCVDSSVCKAGCETNKLPGCDGSISRVSCCYPLSDPTGWRFGDGFSVFSKYKCKGVSSWVVPLGSNVGKRGIKLEWGIPRKVGVCDKNANVINATAIRGGVRCSCKNGFVGDGFASGAGCLKSCFKNGKQAHGQECDIKKHKGKNLVALAGVVAPAAIVSSLLAIFCLLKRPVKQSSTFDIERAHFPTTSSPLKTCKTRQFNHTELEESVNGFEESRKLVDGKNGAIYASLPRNKGSHTAVHKLQLEAERDSVEVLSQIEHLSGVLHRNIAQIVGCCMDSDHSPLVVYEYPTQGTLEKHLRSSKDKEFGLDWCTRLKIASETANVLAFLQQEISPPIFHYNLKSGYIFLNDYHSVKIAGFGFKNESTSHNTDIQDFGLLLLEIITGSKQLDKQTIVLKNFTKTNLEEFVDPSLYYHEQPAFSKEQINIVADIATRCLFIVGDGKPGMVEIAKEITSVNGGSKKGFDEKFSNSSLLQMISMSPDSVPEN